MGFYRKRPVIIEACQTGVDYDIDCEILRWCGGVLPDSGEDADWLFRILTLEGWLYVTPGDWVIKGVKGEFYPCKPDVFAATYTDASIPMHTLPPGEMRDHFQGLRDEWAVSSEMTRQHARQTGDQWNTGYAKGMLKCAHELHLLLQRVFPE